MKIDDFLGEYKKIIIKLFAEFVQKTVEVQRSCGIKRIRINKDFTAPLRKDNQNTDSN